MIHTDGRPTIANAVTRLADLPIELLSDRERRARDMLDVVEEVLGEGCAFCSAETAAELAADEAADEIARMITSAGRVERAVAQEECTFCGLEDPATVWSQTPGIEAVDPAEAEAEAADWADRQEPDVDDPDNLHACFECEPPEMNDNQRAYDARERLAAQVDRERMQRLA